MRCPKTFFPTSVKPFTSKFASLQVGRFVIYSMIKLRFKNAKKKKKTCWVEVKGQVQRPSIRAALSISAASPAKVTPRWNLREKRSGGDPATRCWTPVYSSPLIPWRPGRQTPPPLTHSPDPASPTSPPHPPPHPPIK